MIATVATSFDKPRQRGYTHALSRLSVTGSYVSIVVCWLVLLPYYPVLLSGRRMFSLLVSFVCINYSGAIFMHMSVIVCLSLLWLKAVLKLVASCAIGFGFTKKGILDQV